MSNISQKSFLSKLLDNFRKSQPKSIGLASISAFALMTPKIVTSESDETVNQIPEPIKGVPNAATLGFLSLGFNQPKENPEQWAIFSSDIDQSYVDRYNQIRDDLNAIFGGYMNYNYLIHNRDGPESVNADIAQRLIYLQFSSGWEDGEYSTAEITRNSACLSGANPNGYERDSDYVHQSICLTNKVEMMDGYDASMGKPNNQPEFKIDLEYLAHNQHEYFHHYQRTHTLERGLDKQSDFNAGDGSTSIRAPWWWIEGAAMAGEDWYLRDNWIKFDYLEKYDPEIINGYLESQIETRNQSFYIISRRVQKSDDTNPDGGLTPNLNALWDLGGLDVYDWKLGPLHSDGYPDDANETAIFVAQERAMVQAAPVHFMAHKSSWQAVLRDIPADYYELGFWGAVEKHIGLTEQAFYDEFNALMRSVDVDTISKDYAPEGWKIPEGQISAVVDFLNISPFASASFTVSAKVLSRLGSEIADADVIMSDGIKTTIYKTTSDGSVSGALRESLTSAVKVELNYSSSTKTVTSQDALDALKLSVGLSTSAGTKSTFDFISADFNQDGKVSSQDALSILKYSVGLTTPEQAKWVFVDTNGDYSGVSKSNTSYSDGVSIADLSADTSVSLTGILIGDVNDSYSGLIA